MKKWKQVINIVHKTKNKDIINFIRTGKGFHSDPYTIGNSFNDYFTNLSKLCFLLQLMQKKLKAALGLYIAKNRVISMGDQNYFWKCLDQYQKY